MAAAKAEANKLERRSVSPRPGFRDKVEQQGLLYHSNPDGSPYWCEDHYYALTSAEADKLYAAAKELHGMFLHAAETMLGRPDGLAQLGVPSSLHEVIRRAWERDDWEFYGRFDFTLDGAGTPKLIEYNADTPTGMLEASIVQWYWKEDVFPRADQFNSIHEAMVRRWNEVVDHGQLGRGLIHFTSVRDHPEDRMTTGYLAATAEEAGFITEYLSIDRIGWDKRAGQFVDEQGRRIAQLFKLYPWEWLADEEFAPHLAKADWMVLEPAWKAIFASKKLLLTLEELYPGHLNLLRAWADGPRTANYVAKPVFGREGANVGVHLGGTLREQTEGPFAGGEMIYQEYAPLIQGAPRTFAQLGIWMAGPEPVGLSVREDDHFILRNTSRFVPHILE